MSYLLDTCALSELIKPVPASQVVAWFEAAPQNALFVSALTFGEIRKGIETLPDGRRRDRLAAWLEYDLYEWFDGKVLAVDAAVADEWGRQTAKLAYTLPAIGGLIAATALHHRLTVVTRNVSDFAKFGVEIINPWEIE